MTDPAGGEASAAGETPPGGPWVALPSAPNLMLRDLGPSINAQFFALYDRHLRNALFDEAAFRAAAFDYLDEEFAAGRNPDPFFDNLGFIGLPRPETPVYWLGVWEWALAIVHDWEAAAPGRRVHKGTGYYFAGVRDIALGDLDRGFLYMHQAALEDATSSGSTLPPTPAVWFITLDARSEGQAYYEKVLQYQTFVDARLAEYRASGRGTLTLDDLRDRFVRHPVLLDAVTTMTHVVARILRLGDARTSRIRQGAFAELALSQLALELCLVIEDLFLRASGLHTTFKPLAAWYAPKAGMTLTDRELGRINGRFKIDFDGTMGEVLDGRRVTSFTRTLSDREADLVASYGIRNRSAHGLERPTAAAKEFDRLARR